MSKIITSVCLDADIKEHIDKNTEIESFSAWASERYCSEFMKLESCSKELDKLLKLAEKKKTQILKIKEDQKSLKDKLPAPALTWIKQEGKRRARQYTEEGVYKFFMNKYDLWDKINRRQFKILLEQEG